MITKYKNLSLGYLGLQHTNATLNSKYYAEFFNNIANSSDSLSHILIFPQRTPKVGFFQELITLETPEFKQSFNQQLNKIKKNYGDALNNYTQQASKENARIYINWANILMRYGCFNEINSRSPQKIAGSYSLEIEILKETNRIEEEISNDRPISVRNFLDIAKEYIKNPDTTEREKIMILNRIVVDFYRYQKKSDYTREIVDSSNLLLNIIDNLEKNSFLNILYSSIAYRGLAMVSEFGMHEQSLLLYKAEDLARKLSPKSSIESLVASENLYTCLQSLCKWSLHEGSIPKAERFLQEMVSIDPVDSTGYSELGFFYIRTKSHENAATSFKKAMELGPPGTGMNAYYYAKCLEELGHESQAISYLYKSTELDKSAVSPWLDLMEYHLNSKETDKAKIIAKHLHDTPDLKEQLEEDEIITIQNIIS